MPLNSQALHYHIMRYEFSRVPEGFPLDFTSTPYCQPQYLFFSSVVLPVSAYSSLASDRGLGVVVHPWMHVTRGTRSRGLFWTGSLLRPGCGLVCSGQLRHGSQAAADRAPWAPTAGSAGQRSSAPPPLTPHPSRGAGGSLFEILPAPLDPGTRALGAPSLCFPQRLWPCAHEWWGRCSSVHLLWKQHQPRQKPTVSGQRAGQKDGRWKRVWPGSPNLASPWQLAGLSEFQFPPLRG